VAAASAKMLFNKSQPISVGVGKRELLMTAGDSGYRNAHEDEEVKFTSIPMSEFYRD
jgi:hypothetical protein